MGVSKDALDLGGGTKFRESIGIRESSLFSHAAILPKIRDSEKCNTSSHMVIFYRRRSENHPLTFTKSHLKEPVVSSTKGDWGWMRSCAHTSRGVAQSRHFLGRVFDRCTMVFSALPGHHQFLSPYPILPMELSPGENIYMHLLLQAQSPQNFVKTLLFSVDPRNSWSPFLDFQLMSTP